MPKTTPKDPKWRRSPAGWKQSASWVSVGRAWRQWYLEQGSKKGTQGKGPTKLHGGF